jgi:hypothetical protein
MDLAHSAVVVSGAHSSAAHFTAAAVPTLLAYQNRLFIYYSALEIEGGHFVSIAARGVELTRDARAPGKNGLIAVKAAQTVEVWRPVADNDTLNTTADWRGIWVAGDHLVAAASVGGSGCVEPSDPQRGCFRLMLSRANSPLAPHIFNDGPWVADSALPTNGQEYTRPVVDPQGHWFFIGHYVRPAVNALSEARPAPGAGFWAQNPNRQGVVALYPITETDLIPTAIP